MVKPPAKSGNKGRLRVLFRMYAQANQDRIAYYNQRGKLTPVKSLDEARAYARTNGYVGISITPWPKQPEEEK